MLFSEFIGILEWLAKTPEGATVRQLARANMTTNQRVETIMKKLASEGMVTMSIEPHRPNINKRVWKITEKAVENCAYVATNYSVFESKHAKEVVNNPDVLTYGMMGAPKKSDFKKSDFEPKAKEDQYKNFANDFDESFNSFYNGEGI